MDYEEGLTINDITKMAFVLVFVIVHALRVPLSFIIYH